MALDEPYEFLDLMPGELFIIRVDRYQDGTAVIHPKTPTSRHVRQYMDQNNLSEAPAAGTPIGVEVGVLRLFGERTDQASRAKYWDISSKTLRADLLARLQAGQQLPFGLRLDAIGHAPKKRYSVTVF